jgi:hypothetical protein
MRTFAEIGPGNIVQRVIVADSLEWCAEALGGLWVETYQHDPVQQYAGPGMVFDSGTPEQFHFVTEES